MNKKVITVVLILLAVLLGGYILFFHNPIKSSDNGNGGAVTNFEDCLAAGNAVMESYPRQCRSQNGELFVEDIGNELEKMDLIRIDSPRPNQKITSPLTVSGEARGFWFFEASFPVSLEDGRGNAILSSYIMANGEWMTENFVPFSKTFYFEVPPSGTKGKLILHKDNPSGLPEHDDELMIPVEFSNSELQTFNDKDVGISFQYNPGFQLTKAASNSVTLLKLGPTQAQGTEVYDGLIINLSKIETFTSDLKQAAEKELAEFEIHGEILENLTPVSFADQFGYSFSGSGLGVFKFYIISLDENHYLKISVLMEDPTDQGFETLLKTVLDSIKIN